MSYHRKLVIGDLLSKYKVLTKDEAQLALKRDLEYLLHGVPELKAIHIRDVNTDFEPVMFCATVIMDDGVESSWEIDDDLYIEAYDYSDDHIADNIHTLPWEEQLKADVSIEGYGREVSDWIWKNFFPIEEHEQEDGTRFVGFKKSKDPASQNIIKILLGMKALVKEWLEDNFDLFARVLPNGKFLVEVDSLDHY